MAFVWLLLLERGELPNGLFAPELRWPASDWNGEFLLRACFGLEEPVALKCETRSVGRLGNFWLFAP